MNTHKTHILILSKQQKRTKETIRTGDKSAQATGQRQPVAGASGKESPEQTPFVIGHHWARAALEGGFTLHQFTRES